MAENGGWRQLDNVEALAGARAAVMLDGRLFAAGRDGLLWRVTLDGGAVTAVDGIGESGWDTRLLASAGDRLFAFEENGWLYAIDPATGAWDRLDGDWSNVRAACGVDPSVREGEPHGAELFVAAGNLFVVDVSGAGWQQLGDAEYQPRLLLGDGGSVYSLEENGSLYRIDAHDGSWEQLDGEWGDVCAGAARRGLLFLATEAGSLYVVGRGGEFEPVAEGAPAGLRFLFAAGPGLYGVEPGGALHALKLG